MSNDIRLSINEKRSGLISDKVKLLNLEHFKKDFGCFPGIQKYTIYDFSTIYSTIENLNTLDTYQKNILLVRFNRICSFIKNKYYYIRFYYTASKIYVIITGIINPALLSINVQSNTFWYDYVYWLVWILQIMVSLVTALSSFYKWDKKYFTYKAYKMKIEQELWLYLELIGRYSRINNSCRKEVTLGYTTHETKLNLFLFRLEYLFKRLKDADLDIEITEDEGSRDSTVAINNKIAPRPNDDEDDLSGFTEDAQHSNLLSATGDATSKTQDKNKNKNKDKDKNKNSISKISKLQHSVKKFLKRSQDKKKTETEEKSTELTEDIPKPTEDASEATEDKLTKDKSPKDKHTPDEEEETPPIPVDV